MTIPRNLSLVKFEGRILHPFTGNSRLLFMGEIPNMEEHCVIFDIDTQKTYIGYHTDNFVELTEDEV